MAAAKRTRKKKEEQEIAQDAVVASEEAPKEDAPVVKKKVPFNIEGPVFFEGCLHLSPNDLLRYELLQEKFQSSLQQIGLTHAEKERVVAQANKEIERIQKEAQAKVRALDANMLSLQGVSKGREEELDVFRKALEEKYKLDFRKISYDDTSGKVFTIDDKGNTNPVAS